MYDYLYNAIKENESKGDFTYAKVIESMLTEAETWLGLKLPTAYRWFLINFGQGGIGGIEVLGIGKNGKIVFVDETM